MIAVLIWVLVIVVIFGVAAYIVRNMGLDASTQQLALVIVGIVCLIALLYLLVGLPPWPAGRVP